ncbi:hypothetical protein Pmgp_02496 [Pelotomaculum propionicicum]|uniref:RND related barrel-sandwich hybrid domain-containing protein n=1 Tax=Pelotomaculum propionicicum TaxID=258475 RepID=A0A4Y7RNH5_9FIRM|nr:hypothetical protein Pmgp_02496 [Pelotomaculum propionicicum]
MPSRRRKKPGNLFLKALLLTALLCCAFFLARQFIIVFISDVQSLTSKEVGETVSLDGILLKDENVARAPAGGLLRFTNPDGRRLEVGAKAADIETAGEQGADGQTFAVYTSSAGIFCSHLDGLESTLTPANRDVLDLPGLEKIAGRSMAAGTRVEKGQPIFKIIDNLSPVFIYGSIAKTSLPAGYADKPVWLQAAWNNLTLRIKSSSLVDKGDRWEGYFLLSGYPEAIVHNRKVSLTVTTKQLKGLLVPSRAVVYRAGQPGIYMVVKKKAQWEPVDIKGELAGWVAIAGDELVEGARYVSNPVLVREGWFVE